MAAGLSLVALLITFVEGTSFKMTLLCTIDIVAYLLSYSIKLFIMSNFAKSNDSTEAKKYFVEEQIVAAPLLLIGLFLVGFLGTKLSPASFATEIWAGFISVPKSPYFLHVLALGAFSCGNGLFNNFIHLDKRENTFCVATSRAASVLAGIVATYLLAIFYEQAYPNIPILVSAVIVIGSIFFLVYHSTVEKKKRLLLSQQAVA
jgi:hypothetical protein